MKRLAARDTTYYGDGVVRRQDFFMPWSFLQVLGMFTMPGVIALIMVFARQTRMAELYGIRDNEMGYYLAFALVIIPFSLIMDVFVLNTQEVGWWFGCWYPPR